MNPYAVIVLSALLVEFGLSLTSNLLNLRALDRDLPEEFRGLFDRDAYLKSQSYAHETTRFSLLSEAFSLIVLIVFWFGGGFGWVDGLVRGLDLPPIWTGVIFIGAFVGAQGVLSVPFSLYSTFVIEERYGFNKTTFSTFLLDRLKGLFLLVVLGLPLLAGILAFFEFAGAQAWLYCWGAVIAFTLIMQWVAPTWIMPLFNKFQPLESGELRRAILGYAHNVRFPLDNVYVIDGSRRSEKANAFFMGFGKRKRVALFDTLVQQQTVPELVAVLAHEVGHYKKRHILKGLAVGILHTGLLFWLLSIFITHQGLFEAFHVETASVYAGLIFFALLFSPIELAASVLMNVLSRRHEFEADRFAAETLGEPTHLISALKKLARRNLSNLTPHPFYVFLHDSHPPVLERIAALRGIGPLE